jgi:FkbM family methyltransferase
MAADFNGEVGGMLAMGGQAAEAMELLGGFLRGALRGRPLALCGLWSPVAQSVLDACRSWGLAAACFCDVGGAPGGGAVAPAGGAAVPVVDPDALARDYPGAVAVVCSHSPDLDLGAGLARLGFDGQSVVPWDWASRLAASRMLLDWQASHRAHIDMYSWAFDFFEDEVSKQNVLDRLRYWLCGTALSPNTSCGQYYEDGYVSIGEGEVFVDGGAHQGESALEFLRRAKEAGATRARVHSFEPDQGNFEAAAKNLAGVTGVTLVQKGLWIREAELTFFEKADTLGSSFVLLPNAPEREGAIVHRVPVTSLDAYFGGAPEDCWPTFIKMDIEGAENEALLGAAGVIAAKKPKLAICAYHKPEDVYALPRTIMRLHGGYRFALRHYARSPHETVLYAV